MSPCARTAGPRRPPGGRRRGSWRGRGTAGAATPPATTAPSPSPPRSVSSGGSGTEWMGSWLVSFPSSSRAPSSVSQARCSAEFSGCHFVGSGRGRRPWEKRRPRQKEAGDAGAQHADQGIGLARQGRKRCPITVGEENRRLPSSRRRAIFESRVFTRSLRSIKILLHSLSAYRSKKRLPFGVYWYILSHKGSYRGLNFLALSFFN